MSEAKGNNNIVFVFPHQDDEMMVFHRIRYLQRQKRNLFMVWVTDGAAHNPEVRKSLLIRLTLPLFIRETDEAIRRIRQEESLALMKCLEIPSANLQFLAFPSGRTKNCFPQIVKSLEDIFDRLNPQEIYTVPYDNGGFEHDICNAAVKIASKMLPGVTLYEFPVVNVYHGLVRIHWFIPRRDTQVLRTAFTREEEAERLRLFRTIFKSQWFAAWAESAIGLLPSSYKKQGEPFRRMPEYDYSKRITGAGLNYHLRSLSFKDFKDCVSGFFKS
jgi:LmbE family N-acetylglucosaminyl deacetylase